MPDTTLAQIQTRRIAALEKSLVELIGGMRWWGAQEDGIPEECYDAYERACALVGIRHENIPTTTAVQGMLQRLDALDADIAAMKARFDA